MLNPSEVYEIELDGKTYYPIRELEDGDFIATDKEKRVYSITHDPYGVTLLSEDLLGYLKSISGATGVPCESWIPSCNKGSE